MTFNTANHYSKNTDVWVFGTPDQYMDFGLMLKKHKDLKLVPADDRGGMDLLILPPAKRATRKFIVIHERLVHQRGRFNMELIIGGTKGGFKLLAKAFRQCAKRYSGNPDEHVHFDSDEEALILPSVFLNIRGPVLDMECLKEELDVSGSDDLPDMAGCDPELWAYDPLEDYESLFGRIPIKPKK